MQGGVSSSDGRMGKSEGMTRDLSREEEEQLRKAGLLHLHNIMNKHVNKEIAKEAIEKYEEDKQ